MSLRFEVAHKSFQPEDFQRPWTFTWTLIGLDAVREEVDKWSGVGRAWYVLEGLKLHADGRGEEYYAAVKGASEAIGFQSACKDLGIDLRIRVLTDSSACRGICGRTDLWKVKHMASQMLWLQDVVRRGGIKRVRGDVNAADLMTKILSRSKIDAHVQCVWDFELSDEQALNDLRFFSNLGQSFPGRRGVLGNELQISAFVSDLLHAPACGRCPTPWPRRACGGQMTNQDAGKGYCKTPSPLFSGCDFFLLRLTCEIRLKMRVKTLSFLPVMTCAKEGQHQKYLI